MVHQSYQQFARQQLQQRRQLALPPFAYLAQWRCEGDSLHAAEGWLHQLCAAFDHSEYGVTLLGPLPAPMAKRGGRYRAQLVLQARSRNALHQCIEALLLRAEQQPPARSLRWSLDIDPVDLF